MTHVRSSYIQIALVSLLILTLIIFVKVLQCIGCYEHFKPRMYIYSTHSSEVKVHTTLFALLGRGDNVSIDVASCGSPWRFAIEIVDVVSRTRYSYEAIYYSLRSPTPVFVAPRSSLYVFDINVTVMNASRTCIIAFSLNVVQGDRLDLMLRMLFASSIVASLLVLLLRSRFTLARRFRFLELMAWEFGSGSMWPFFVATMLSYGLVCITMDSYIDESFNTVLLHPIAIHNDFLILYLVLCASATALAFTYRYELGLEKTMDLLPVSRITRFVARFVTLLATLYLPIVLAAIIVIVLWIQNVLVTFMCLYFVLLQMLYCLGIFAVFLSISLLPSVALSRTTIALVSVLVIGSMLLIKPLPGLPDLFNIINHANPIQRLIIMHTTQTGFQFVVRESLKLLLVPCMYMISTLLISIPLALYIYLRREST